MATSEKLCPILMHAMPQYLDNCECKGARCAWWTQGECGPAALQGEIEALGSILTEIVDVLKSLGGLGG
jgi:hypothetical protein